MKLQSIPLQWLLGIAAVAAVGLYVLARARPGESIATSIGAAAGSAVAEVGAGAVLGVGDVLGVPRTDETECQKALREGRLWDASFACPAGTFIGGAWGAITGD